MEKATRFLIVAGVVLAVLNAWDSQADTADDMENAVRRQLQAITALAPGASMSLAGISVDTDANTVSVTGITITSDGDTPPTLVIDQAVAGNFTPDESGLVPQDVTLEGISYRRGDDYSFALSRMEMTGGNLLQGAQKGGSTAKETVDARERAEKLVTLALLKTRFSRLAFQGLRIEHGKAKLELGSMAAADLVDGTLGRLTIADYRYDCGGPYCLAVELASVALQDSTLPGLLANSFLDHDQPASFPPAAVIHPIFGPLATVFNLGTGLKNTFESMDCKLREGGEMDCTKSPFSARRRFQDITPGVVARSHLGQGTLSGLTMWESDGKGERRMSWTTDSLSVTNYQAGLHDAFTIGNMTMDFGGGFSIERMNSATKATQKDGKTSLHGTSEISGLVITPSQDDPMFADLMKQTFDGESIRLDINGAVDVDDNAGTVTYGPLEIRSDNQFRLSLSVLFAGLTDFEKTLTLLILDDEELPGMLADAGLKAVTLTLEDHSILDRGLTAFAKAFGMESKDALIDRMTAPQQRQMLAMAFGAERAAAIFSTLAAFLRQGGKLDIRLAARDGVAKFLTDFPRMSQNPTAAGEILDLQLRHQP